MGTIVYGGSPRHHSNRISVSTGGSMSNASCAPPIHANPLHQSTPYISSSSTPNQSPSITMPPSSYMSPHYQHHPFYQNFRYSKRKSAAELLAESKPYYIKSESVLDRQPQPNIRGCPMNSSFTSCGFSPSRMVNTLTRPGSSTSRRSVSSGSDLFQTKLRKLLNTSDSKETITPTDNPLAISKLNYKSESTKDDIYSHYPSNKYSQELSINADLQNDDLAVFFPNSFLSPQSLPPQTDTVDDIYSIGVDNNLILTDDYRAISPPAEYAESPAMQRPDVPIDGSNRHNYHRSNSHTQDAQARRIDSNSPTYNINSHKSLPDLHSQTSRHSPRSETFSCCSRGNRSVKSGSSFNRDSGGSSGHYTHRSEPGSKPHLPSGLIYSQHDNSVELTRHGKIIGGEHRRDSGSSTQHSDNSYYNYGVHGGHYGNRDFHREKENLLNFTTPEVPEAFQDDYTPIKMSAYDQRVGRHSHHYLTGSPKTTDNCGTELASPDGEVSPPLGTFKRQKCLRFKYRSNRYSSSERRGSDEDRKPILRSKSDICDRYWQRNSSSLNELNFSGGAKLSLPCEKPRTRSESVAQLEHFFDRLGLNDEKYEEFIMPKPNYSSDNDSDQSSAVFFSDVSTVDSTKLPDSTDTAQSAQPARVTEPPSIVERNARIIKWLCNCRKMQLT